jgi:hypothetical protein
MKVIEAMPEERATTCPMAQEKILTNFCSRILLAGWAKSVIRVHTGLLSQHLLFYSTQTRWNTSLDQIEGHRWNWRLPEATSTAF